MKQWYTRYRHDVTFRLRINTFLASTIFILAWFSIVSVFDISGNTALVFTFIIPLFTTILTSTTEIMYLYGNNSSIRLIKSIPSLIKSIVIVISAGFLIIIVGGFLLVGGFASLFEILGIPEGTVVTVLFSRGIITIILGTLSLITIEIGFIRRIESIRETLTPEKSTTSIDDPTKPTKNQKASHERPNLGETFTAEIDRVSRSGNGIVQEYEGREIKLGPVSEDAVGKLITAEMKDSQSAIILEPTEIKRETDSKNNQVSNSLSPTSRSDETEDSYQSDKSQGSEFKEEINSMNSKLAEVDELITDNEWQKARNYLDDVESRLNSLEKEHTNRQLVDEIEAIQASLNNKKETVEKQERKIEIQDEIDSIDSELAKIDRFITDAEFQEAKNLLDDIKSDISCLTQQTPQDSFDDIRKELQSLTKESNDRLSKSHSLTILREMSPYEFEEFVAKLWEKQGWNAQVTSGSTDRGVDVIATKEDTFEKRRHFIQVKRHSKTSKVGSEDIQRYAGLYARRDEKPDAVFVVTSNTFTKEAKKVAKNRDVRTVDRDELYQMLIET